MANEVNVNMKAKSKDTECEFLSITCSVTVLTIR